VNRRGAMKQENREKKGFTIIELMIVIAIISIMAAVSIPLYDSYKRSAMRAEAIGELISVTSSQEDCFNSYRKYCSLNDLMTYYGVLDAGKHHSLTITLADSDQTFTAEVFICYDKKGTECNTGNKDLRCVVTNSSDTPECN
jgi:prepilin-type N-terminal cleavage/methylation domain-containing protein